MTRVEFAEALAYVGFATGRPLEDRKAVEVYFDLLGDLPADVFRLAVRRVVLEHRWATFPTVAEFRAAAVDCARGEISGMSEAEAWALAWRVAAETDPEVPDSFRRACERHKAPPLVVEAVTKFGLLDLCYGKEPVGVLRGQFLKVYSQLAGRDRKLAILPPAMRAGLEQRRPAIPPAPVRALADSFGMPEGRP